MSCWLHSGDCSGFNLDSTLIIRNRICSTIHPPTTHRVWNRYTSLKSVGPLHTLLFRERSKEQIFCNTKLTRYIFILIHSEVQWICTQILYHTNHSTTLLEYSSFLSKLITLSITMCLSEESVELYPQAPIHRLRFPAFSIHRLQQKCKPASDFSEFTQKLNKIPFLFIKRKNLLKEEASTQFFQDSCTTVDKIQE